MLKRALILILVALPALAKADYRLIQCQSAQLPDSALLVKVNMGRGIVATSEDSWFESEGEGAFSKLSQPFALDLYTKARASREGQNFVMDLETATESLRLTLSSKIDQGKFEVVGTTELYELTCAPAQVP